MNAMARDALNISNTRGVEIRPITLCTSTINVDGGQKKIASNFELFSRSEDC
jgi:hypothetical protein